MGVGKNSRWNRTDLIDFRDQFGTPLRRVTFDYLPRYTAINRADNRTYRIQQVDDWASLSYRTLGVENNWWAIAEFNQIVDPFDEIAPGKSLVVPSVFAVEFDVLNFEFAVVVDVGLEAIT